MRRTDPGALTRGGQGWQGGEGLEGGVPPILHPSSLGASWNHRGPAGAPVLLPGAQEAPTAQAASPTSAESPNPATLPCSDPAGPPRRGLLGVTPWRGSSLQGPSQLSRDLAGKIGAHWGQPGAGKGLWVWEWTQNERPGGREGGVGWRRGSWHEGGANRPPRTWQWLPHFAGVLGLLRLCQ